MKPVTANIAKTINSVPKYNLIAYFGNWYHIQVTDLPPRLLCGRPVGSKPKPWTPTRRRPPSPPRQLCDECLDEFTKRHANVNMPP